jgi:hypothetical protein
MRVPLADVVQLPAESVPSTYRKRLVKERNPLKRYPRPSILTLRRCSKGNLDVPAAPQSHKDSAGFGVMICRLPVLVNLPQHR